MSSGVRSATETMLVADADKKGRPAREERARFAWLRAARKVACTLAAPRSRHRGCMYVVVGWPLAMQLQRFPKDARGTVNHRSLDLATHAAHT